MNQPMENQPRPVLTPGLIFGFVVVIIGVFLLLWNLGVIEGRSVWRYWPAGLIAVGAAKMTQPDTPSSRLWGGVLIATGSVLLLEHLGYFRFRLRDNLWPIAMIAFGLFLIGRTLRGRATEGVPTSVSYLNHWVAFGGLGIKNNSQEFRGGDGLAAFGGIEFDLRNAALAANEAVINANCAFGGIELRVPKDWTVTCQGMALFGGFEDKSEPPPAANPPTPPKRLIVKGFAVFGGVEIKN